MGVTVALPLLDAMVPAGTALAQRRAAAPKLRLSPSRWCTASAGSTAFGAKKNLWSPADDRARLRPGADQRWRRSSRTATT